MILFLMPLGHYHNKAETELGNPRLKIQTEQYGTRTQQQFVSNLSQQQREIRQRRAQLAAAAPWSIKKRSKLSSYVCGRSSLAIRGLANRNICNSRLAERSFKDKQKPISCPPLAVSNMEHFANLAYQGYCKRNKQEGFEPPQICNPSLVWIRNQVLFGDIKLR